MRGGGPARLAFGAATAGFGQASTERPACLPGFGGGTSTFRLAAARRDARVSVVPASGGDRVGRRLPGAIRERRDG